MADIGQDRPAPAARLDDLPTGDRVRIVVGGGHPEVLRAGARYADVVGLAGLGRTLPDGHRHEVRWSPADLDRMLSLVHDEAQQASRTPVIEALVQGVTVTPDRAAAVQELADRFESSADDFSSTPFLLVGTHEEMAAQLQAQAGELGITSYVVREPAVPALERVLSLLAVT